jgi:hypothetical protein
VQQEKDSEEAVRDGNEENATLMWSGVAHASAAAAKVTLVISAATEVAHLPAAATTKVPRVPAKVAHVTTATAVRIHYIYYLEWSNAADGQCTADG